MDWATFFKENSQSLFTLGGVFLGSLITFLINWLNLRNQSSERDKDRQEQRREAEIQAREKWIQRDILKIMEALEKIIDLLSQNRNFHIEHEMTIKAKDAELLSEQDYTAKAQLLYDNFINRVSEVNQYSDMISRLVYSFEEAEIISAYKDFVNVLGKYINEDTKTTKNALSEDSVDSDLTEIAWLLVGRQAGVLQRVLREKLISIRE